MTCSLSSTSCLLKLPNISPFTSWPHSILFSTLCYCALFISFSVYDFDTALVKERDTDSDSAIFHISRQESMSFTASLTSVML